jgi:hypothetical protein
MEEATFRHPSMWVAGPLTSTSWFTHVRSPATLQGVISALLYEARHAQMTIDAIRPLVQAADQSR